MRKILTIFGVLAGLGAIIFLLLPVLLSVTGLDKTIADYFVEKFSQNNEKTISFSKIDVGYHSIKLDEIQFISRTQGINLEIRGLEFDYNIFDLIQNIKEPHKSIDRISFLEPKIVLTENSEPQLEAINEGDTVTFPLSEFVDQFENIDRIYLKEGKILIQRSHQNEIMLAHNLEGWVNAADIDAVQLLAVGDLLYGTGKNFKFDCLINPRLQEFEAQVELSGFNIRHVRQFDTQDNLKIHDGVLNGNILLRGSHFNTDSISLNGTLTLADVAVGIYDLEFDRLRIPIELRDNSLSVSKGSGYIAGSAFSFSGQISNVFNPKFDGQIHSEELLLGSFAAYIDTSGISHVGFKTEARFEFSPESYQISSQISAQNFLLQSLPIDRASLRVLVKDGMLKIPRFEIATSGFEIDGTGNIDLYDGKYQANLNSHHNLGQYVLLDRVSGGQQFASIDIYGNYLDRSLSGSWNYHIQQNEDTIFAVDGSTELKEAVFNFKAIHSTAPDFMFSAQVSDIFNQPKINYGYVKDVPYQVFSSHKWIKELAEINSIESVIGGPIDKLNFQFAINNRTTQESNIKLTTHLEGLLGAERHISGQLSVDRFSTDYNLRIGDNYLKGHFKSNASLRGLVDINMTEDQQIASSVHLNGFPLAKLFSDSLMENDGELFGIVEIEGNLDNPNLSADLRAEKMIINDIGYYTFALTASADTSQIQIDSLQIDLNNTPILAGKLNVDLETQTIQAEANGRQIDADYIFQTIFREKEIITGFGDYRLALYGPLHSPRIESDIHIVNGELADVPFDEISFSVNDSLAANTSFFNYENHMIQVNDFIMLKGGLYHLEAEGNLPLYEDREIDVDIKFDGDFFSFLPRADKVFADGACFATIQLAIGGTPNRIRITDGFIEFERGELWLNEVVDHIENMSGRIEIASGTNHVNISHLYGEVEGRSLVINSVRNITTSDNTELEHWYFEDLDLDFGILEMETPEGGVSIQINGFMLDGERGEIAISGREENEKFYFAGPVEAPHAWGSATLSNTQFTFPFTSSGAPDQELPPAVEFLTRVYWDVIAYAGQDVDYVRKIPAFLGEVDAEVSIDPRSEGLHMRGVIKDDSFKPNGGMHSSKGRIDYLDLTFRVENFGVMFNSTEILPEVYGRAWTSVRDSIGAAPKTIYLELYGQDPESGQESIRSRWEDLRFRLVSADPTVGETQEQVLAYLGYSVDNISEKASQVGGAVTDNYIIRPLLRPIERNIERYLGIDFVRFNSGLTKNLFAIGFNQSQSNRAFSSNIQYNPSLQPYALLLQSSEVTVGKYLSQDLYLSYTGQLVASNINNQNQFNFNHSVGLEYRFLQNLLVEFEYYREAFQFYQIYNDKSYLEDFKIRFRHSFAF